MVTKNIEKLANFIASDEIDEMIEKGMKVLSDELPEIATLFQLEGELAERLQFAFQSAYGSGVGQGYLKGLQEMEKESD